jgi:hypothetical protein
VIPQQRIEDATENCDVMNVVLTDPKPKHPKDQKQAEYRQCIAVMGQWSSYHVHKWTRGNTGLLQYSQAQRPVLPSPEETRASNLALQSYLSVYEDAKEKLRPLAEKAARGADGELGPIIVMAANYGQSNLFINFVCTAKARGLDISRVLLFATDNETYELAQALGITVFYDERVCYCTN